MCKLSTKPQSSSPPCVAAAAAYTKFVPASCAKHNKIVNSGSCKGEQVVGGSVEGMETLCTLHANQGADTKHLSPSPSPREPQPACVCLYSLSVGCAVLLPGSLFAAAAAPSPASGVASCSRTNCSCRRCRCCCLFWPPL